MKSFYLFIVIIMQPCLQNEKLVWYNLRIFKKIKIIGKKTTKKWACQIYQSSVSLLQTLHKKVFLWEKNQVKSTARKFIYLLYLFSLPNVENTSLQKSKKECCNIEIALKYLCIFYPRKNKTLVEAHLTITVFYVVFFTWKIMRFGKL